MIVFALIGAVLAPFILAVLLASLADYIASRQQTR